MVNQLVVVIEALWVCLHSFVLSMRKHCSNSTPTCSHQWGKPERWSDLHSTCACELCGEERVVQTQQSGEIES